RPPPVVVEVRDLGGSLAGDEVHGDLRLTRRRGDGRQRLGGDVRVDRLVLQGGTRRVAEPDGQERDVLRGVSRLRQEQLVEVLERDAQRDDAPLATDQVADD